MVALALAPVSEAVYRTLMAEQALLDATAGGWHSDLPQAPVYPCGWFEVSERETGVFGLGGLPEVELRVYVLSQYEGMAEAHAITKLAIHALKNKKLTVEGYAHAGDVFYDETIKVQDQEDGGKKTHELVSLFRIYVEED